MSSTAQTDRLAAPANEASPRTLALTLPQLWLFIAVALPVLGALVAPLPTVDLAYQVRAGGEFLDTGRITLADTYTFTVAGDPWLNQQWASQAILAGVHRLGGWEGLAVLRAALVGLTFGLVLLASRIRGAGPRVAAGLTLAAFAVSMGALALRPQLFGMALFAATLALVALRRDRPRLVWLTIPLIGLWANIHGSFFLGPAILGIAWLEDLHDHRSEARRTFLVGALATAATLVNPFLLGVWAYALGLSTNSFVTNAITEWQPTSIRSVTGALFYASVLGVVALLARRGRPTPWPTLAWLGFLFVLGVYAVRGTAWWPIGAAVVVAGIVGTLSTDARPALSGRPRALNTALAAAVGLAIVALLPWWKPADPETGRDGLLSFAPSALTTELRDLATPDDRLLAWQPWGSWLELAVPEAPLFVDARFELFGSTVWDDYVAIVNTREDWRELLERRGVTLIALPVEEERLADALAADDGWRRAYEGDDGSIFVRADRS